MRQFGEEVNGAGGNFAGMLNNTTGYPVAFNPYNQLQRSVMSADPMSQIGNIAHGQHTTDSFINGVPVYWPGSHNPREHIGDIDPAGKEIPGTRPKDSEIPLYPGSSSNLPAAKPIYQSGSGIPGAPGNIKGIAGQITDDQRMQFAMENPGSKSQLGGGFFRKYLS
jgi:hypothetical protein